MNFIEQAKETIGRQESDTLEYMAVLPPPKTIAQLISGFANTGGGLIILGVHVAGKKVEVVGLSPDFKVNSVLHAAQDLLNSSLQLKHGYFSKEDKNLYAIRVEQSTTPVLVDGKAYKRIGERTIPLVQETVTNVVEAVPELKAITEKISLLRANATAAKNNFLDHYQNIVNIIGHSSKILFPNSPSHLTTMNEGKILSRILFASSIDNFETYLSELLFEIFLAVPASLKNDQQVTIKEVLDCSDMEEFVVYWSKKKLGQLQRGSVKGFLQDTQQLSTLNAIDQNRIDSIDKAFQIRHLYTHRNGVIDEKFLRIYPGRYNLNDRHEMTVVESLATFDYLIESVDIIDKAAIRKFRLGTV